MGLRLLRSRGHSAAGHDFQHIMQVSFASEVAELVQERDSLVAAYVAAQDTAAELQQQNG